MNTRDFLLDTMTKKMIAMCCVELELSPNDLPTIKMVNDTGHSSFGIFDGGIMVATFNRHPMDVMRTLAHELVHLKQMQCGQTLDGSDGSGTEDAANAIAGTIMRKFGKKYPQFFTELGG